MNSNSYGTVNIDLRNAFVEVIKKIFIKKIDRNTENNETSLEAFLVCELIPIEKNSGLPPTGVGVLQKIAASYDRKFFER